MDDRKIVSVGVDVGTTTTHVVFSKLTLANRARAGLVPRVQVNDRVVLFTGQPHLTPMLSDELLDAERVAELVRQDYADAKIDPSEVATGAVVITGEAARTQNAEAVLDQLAGLAGDFVVTVAGPSIEARLAGRGSGAADWSASHYARVINLDIGGGSSNAILYRSGREIASNTAMVGGRQLMLDPSTGVVTGLRPAARAIVEKLGLGLKIGERADLAELRRLTDAMADVIVALCMGQTSPLGEQLTTGDELRLDGPVAAYFISGGVGELYYEQAPANTMAEIGRWGDVGPLLALSLREHPGWSGLRVERPTQTCRATVLGAASQQVRLSGSTIWAEGSQLPLRNAPVIEAQLAQRAPGLDDPRQIAAALSDGVTHWYRGLAENGHFVVALDLPQRLNYAKMLSLAEGIVAFARQHLSGGQPLVLTTEVDYAQVLGQTIKQQRPDLPLVVVDQVSLAEGDFVDIGEPLFEGRVVPVSVKTLVFQQKAAAR